jgi:hypothetical protein
MADPACVALKIPERLHTEDRKPDQQFEPSEVLYRWLPKTYPQTELKASFRLTQDESVNRGKYSKYPADVLFNIKGPHRVGHPILAFEVRQLRQQLSRRENNEDAIYSFDVCHKPENCMYPHCAVEVRRNGQLADTLPGVIRKRVRDSIADSEERKILTNHPLPED